MQSTSARSLQRTCNLANLAFVLVDDTRIRHGKRACGRNTIHPGAEASHVSTPSSDSIMPDFQGLMAVLFLALPVLPIDDFLQPLL